MKTLIVFFILVCLLSSCQLSESSVSLSSVSLSEQKDLTTIEMQDAAKNNPQVYKVIQGDNNVYLINPDTNLVEKEIRATSSPVDSILEFILTLLVIVFIFL